MLGRLKDIPTALWIGVGIAVLVAWYFLFRTTGTEPSAPATDSTPPGTDSGTASTDLASVLASFASNDQTLSDQQGITNTAIQTQTQQLTDLGTELANLQASIGHPGQAAGVATATSAATNLNTPSNWTVVLGTGENGIANDWRAVVWPGSPQGETRSGFSSQADAISWAQTRAAQGSPS